MTERYNGQKQEEEEDKVQQIMKMGERTKLTKEIIATQDLVCILRLDFFSDKSIAVSNDQFNKGLSVKMPI